MSRLSLAALLAVASVLPACGSTKASPGGQDAGTTLDADTDGAEDANDEDSAPAYPAFAVDLPQITRNQGTVLTSPVIVTVTWPGDSNASTWEAFGDGIGASSYWSATTAQYGVGPATSGSSNHVRMTQALPATLSYTDLQNLVVAAVEASQSDAGAAGSDGGDDAGAPNPVWPAPTTDAKGYVETIYTLFIGPTTSVIDPGSGQSFCDEGALGYHDNVFVSPGNTPIAYAVTLECAGLTDADNEETAAHEAVEAATDPYVETESLGYVGFDANHLAWDIYTGFQDELADACENWQDSYYQESADFPYWVQRTWSNAAASKGTAPCVPAPTSTYYGMTLFPADESSVTVDLSSAGFGKSTSKGFKVSVGQPSTFQVGFFSDAAMPAWTISYDFPSETQLYTENGSAIGNGSATVSIDKTSGQNGDKANVTVTVKTKGTAGFHIMAITWQPPTTKFYLPKYLPVLLVDD